ncbi:MULTISPECIES: hypothetical protein [Moorena]|nr:MULTISPECIES: hypothetical protein [Moorena]NES82135.1 hypothetical protein [Moorena sp. SIO2B7]NEP34243.1 hypothetical protein [Moorena sp. SIO3B2]NEP68159.1 hypothetical protein [Moorena sp. SIO3A5]NEQ06875.1 hypothetical protein [Moorena sp. SIO4E2]NER90547.1 hypothetical protein [Moorena sp. SIO3A2]
MKTLNLPISSCRFCQYYQSEGRRGGMCQQLGVPVRASWKACAFAVPTFSSSSSSWETLEQMWQDEQLMLTEELSVTCSETSSGTDTTVQGETITSKSSSTDIMLV